MMLVTGRWGGRRARRPLIAVGYGLAATGKVVVALAVLWPVVLAGPAVEKVGKGIRGATRDALLLVHADPGLRGRAFGSTEPRAPRATSSARLWGSRSTSCSVTGSARSWSSSTGGRGPGRRENYGPLGAGAARMRPALSAGIGEVGR